MYRHDTRPFLSCEGAAGPLPDYVCWNSINRFNPSQYFTAIVWYVTHAIQINHGHCVIKVKPKASIYVCYTDNYNVCLLCTYRCRVIDNEDALNDLLDSLTESNDDLTESNDDLTTSSDHMTAKRLPIVFYVITFVIIQVHKYF